MTEVDWKAEARCAAWYILDIKHKWDMFDGDNEFFRDALEYAYQYVDGPLRDMVDKDDEVIAEQALRETIRSWSEDV